jgi:hypothetical protein
MAKGRDLAFDVVLMDQLFDVTIYICVGTVLGRRRRSLVSKNMNSEEKRWIR